MVTSGFQSILQNEKNTRGFALFCVGLLLVGLIFSPFLLSVSMWGLVIAALWNVWLELPETPDKHHFSLKNIQKILKNAFARFGADKAYSVLSLLFLLVFLSGLWSDGYAYWLERTRVRIPFFVLPFAFVNLPNFNAHEMKSVLYFLVWLLFMTCIGIGLNFYANYDTVMQAIQEGRPVPVPRSHIRFNLTLATGIIGGIWLWTQQFFLKYRWERGLFGFSLLFLFVFIHILAVRSGLAALYVALVFGLFWWIWESKRWLAGGLCLLFVMLVPLVAVNVVPSFRQKLDYMRWDYLQYSEKKGAEYSDSGRLISLAAGWKLFKAHPVIGVGTGDLVDEMQKQVNADHPQYRENVKLPHNQFLYILTATGLFGFLVSIYALYFPVFIGKYRHFFLFSVFQWIAFTSFLVEYTLETSIGLAFFLFFQLWFMKMGEIWKTNLNN